MVKSILLHMLILSLFPVSSLKLGTSDALFDPLQMIYIPGNNLDKNQVSHFTGVTSLNLLTLYLYHKQIPTAKLLLIRLPK